MSGRNSQSAIGLDWVAKQAVLRVMEAHEGVAGRRRHNVTVTAQAGDGSHAVDWQTEYLQLSVPSLGAV